MKKIKYRLFIIFFIAITSLWGQEWEVISEMPIPVKGAQAIVQNSLVYIIGGYSDSTFSPINKIQIFNPQDTSWIVIEDTLNVSRYGHVVVKDKDKAWIFGGGSTEDSLDKSLESWDFITSPKIVEYDPVFNRQFATAQIFDNLLYIFGGYSTEVVEDSNKINYMIVYDIEGKSFVYSDAQDFVAENTPIHQMSAKLGNSVFIFGGDIWGISRNIYLYDVSENAFTDLGNPLINARAGGSTVVLDESTIALIGGYNEVGPMASVEVLSIEYNYIHSQEITEKPLNYARSEPAVVKVDSFVYVFGGKDSFDNCIPFVEKAYIETQSATVIESKDRINPVNDFELFQNYPNPFNPATTIIFSNQESMQINLDIYSINGSHIKSLVNGYLNVGSHQIIWDGTDKNNNPVSSGVYFYKCDNGIMSETKRMILLR
ncbi:MAG: T9SS type A sorting domain-containing protein [Calditrichaceae bacterium]